MTVISTSIFSGPYIGNDVATNFAYSFTVQDKTQLSVYETDDNGVETLLTVDTHYTVSDIGVEGGGDVIRVAGALPTDYKWVIRSNRVEDQQTSFESQGAFFPDVHEKQMDHLTYLSQQLRDSADRSLKFSDTYSGALKPKVGTPVTGNLLRWKSPTEIESVDFVGLGGLLLGTVVEELSASAGQSVFNLSNSYLLGTNNISVYVNGIRQESDAYVETDTTTITFTENLNAGDKVAFIVNERSVTPGVVPMTSVTGTVDGFANTNVNIELNRTRKLVFDTVTDMQAATNLRVGDIVDTAGYSSTGDGGGNTYEIVPIATGTDDGGSFIDLANSFQAKGLFPNDLIYDKQFGATYNGTTNDQAAIQAALDYAKSLGRGTVYASQGTALVDSQLEVNVSKVRFIGNNTKFDFSNLGFGGAIKVTGDIFLAETEQTFGGLEGFKLIGPGKGTSTKGLVFDTPAEAGTSHTHYRAVDVEQFGIGHEYKNYAYSQMFYNCDISECGTLIDMPDGFTNYGKNISYFGGTFYNSDAGVKIANANGEINFFGSTIEFNGTVAVATKGHINFQSCHIEFNSVSNPLTGVPFQCVGNGTDAITIKDGQIVNNTNPYNQAYVVDVPLTGEVYIENCVLEKLTTTSGYFKNDIGYFRAVNNRFLTGGGNFDVSILGSVIENQAADGTFESFTAVDKVEWYLSKDTATITSRITGANVAITADGTDQRTGTYCMKVAKTGGAGTNAAVRLIVPIQEDQQYFNELWIKGDGALTGNAVISSYFVAVHLDSNGIPITQRELAYVGSENFDTSLTTYTNIRPAQVRTPAYRWATHYAIDINLDAVVGAGSVFVDDVLICS
jgi:hypothetical protein